MGYSKIQQQRRLKEYVATLPRVFINTSGTLCVRVKDALGDRRQSTGVVLNIDSLGLRECMGLAADASEMVALQIEVHGKVDIPWLFRSAPCRAYPLNQRLRNMEQPFSRDDISRLIRVAKLEQLPVFANLFGLMFETGISCSEVRELKPGNLSGKKLTVNGRHSTGRKVRVLELSEAALGYWPKTSGSWVFSFDGESLLRRQVISYWFMRICTIAGFTQRPISTIRDAYVLELLKRGVAIPEIANSIGRANPDCKLFKAYTSRLNKFL